jgi:hypothetical protein
MNIKKLFFFFFIVTIIFSSCHKFPDGPYFSLRTRKARVTGTWKVEKYYVNNIDSTDEYIQRLGCQIEFTKDKYNNTDSWYIVKLSSCNNGKVLTGYWVFENNRDNTNISDANFNITLNFDTSFLSVIPLVGDDRGYSHAYKILRLTNKEFNLIHYADYNIFGKTYLLKLKKVED